MCGDAMHAGHLSATMSRDGHLLISKGDDTDIEIVPRLRVAAIAENHVAVWSELPTTSVALLDS